MSLFRNVSPPVPHAAGRKPLGGMVSAYVLLLTALTVGYVAAQGMDSGEVDHVELPLQLYDSGKVKTMLKADKAIMPPAGLIEGSNVVVEMYAENGGLEGVLTSPKVFYDRRHQRAACRGRTTLQRKNIRIEGDAVVWVAEYQKIIIETNACVRLLRAPGLFKGVAP